MNPAEWGIKKLIVVTAAFQVLILGLLALDVLGLSIPIFRQIVGFIFLSFVPGILVLRILRWHRLGLSEALLYSIGLSLALLLFVGVSINTLFPYLGINRPISTVPLVLTQNLICLVLCIIAYYRDKGFSGQTPAIHWQSILNPPILTLLLLPLISILGAYLFSVKADNRLSLAMLGIIALIVTLIAFGKFFPNRLYPLAIVAIALSLLFHTSLSSLSLVGTDIRFEYYFHKLVEANGYWDSTAPAHAYNATLSVTLLPTIYSSILGIEGTWVFKVVFPIFFSLVALAIYEAYRQQIGERIGFWAAFYFISVYQFYNMMLELGKMQIAELFFALLALLIVSPAEESSKKRVAFLVFAIAMVVSHYGTSYTYLLIVALAAAILILTRYRSPLLTINFVLLFCIIAFSWYFYNARSTAFVTVLNLGSHFYDNFLAEFFNPRTREGVMMATAEMITPIRLFNGLLNYVAQLFIAVGVIRMLAQRKTLGFGREYIALSIGGAFILAASVLLPFFSRMVGTARIYGLALIFLAPACILGGETIFRNILRVLRILRPMHEVLSRKAVSVFLVLFLLFSTRFVYSLANDRPLSIALDSSRDYPRFNEQEVSGAEWILSEMNPAIPLYTDYYAAALFWAYRTEYFTRMLNTGDDAIRPDEAYIFLRPRNISDKKLSVYPQGYISLEALGLGRQGKIYDNGGVQIYKRR